MLLYESVVLCQAVLPIDNYSKVVAKSWILFYRSVAEPLKQSLKTPLQDSQCRQ